MRPALPLLALVLAAGQAPAAEPLGRLFYTPAQRVQLDALRSQKSTAPAPEREEPTPVPELVTYGGVVRRSDGKTTVWINDRVVNDGKAADSLAISGRIRSDDTLRLQLPQTGRSIDLKVGQSVETVSGVVAERYARSPVRTKPQSNVTETRNGKAAAKPDTASAGTRGAGRDEEDDERGNR